jgi:hypothetical protein
VATQTYEGRPCKNCGSKIKYVVGRYCVACKKSWNATLEAKIAQRAYKMSPRGRAAQKAYRNRPETKVRQRAWHAGPKAKAYTRSPARRLFTSYKVGVAGRGLVWALSDARALALMSMNCTYCGGPGYGIDRVDNDKGYTFKNSVPCCSVCNRAKFRMSAAEFVAWGRRFYDHSIRRKP